MNRKYSTIVATICCFSSTFCANGSTNVVEEAYQLRMTGKLDQANELLSKELEAAPNAATHFEMARTQMHKALGDPKQLVARLKNAQNHIAQAVKLEPKNQAFHSLAGHIAFFQAYYARQTRSPHLNKHLLRAIGSFEAALAVNQDSAPVMLYLVELHSQFPKSAGADRLKAEQYAEKLKLADDFFAAKAQSILTPESCDVSFWNSVSAKYPNNADAYEELAKSHLKVNQVELAEEYITKAIQIDPKKNYLLLDLSIYHTFQAMRARNRDDSQFDASVAAGESAVARYLKSNPNQPMQAYALGVQSKYASATGKKDLGDELVRRANRLDPYFSKATGAPLSALFAPPTSTPHRHRYLTRPY